MSRGGCLKKHAAISVKGLNRKIARTQQLVEKSVNIVHQFARELRPTVLDDLGLVPALHTFLKSFQTQTGIRVTLSAFAAIEQVSGDKRTALFRVAQEALTNVARHAQASHVQAKIQKVDNAVTMTIKDDGKGFAMGRLSQAKQYKRLGMIGMRERLEMVGGSFSVRSTPGKGTIIQARIPLAQMSNGALKIR
jgi:two-component system sensor histidine kinase DegS